MVYLFAEDQQNQTLKRSTVFKEEFFVLDSSEKNVSMQNILSNNKVNTMYKLFIKEVVLDVLREHRLGSPFIVLNLKKLLSVRNNVELIPPINARTGKKPLANFLILTLKRLNELNLIPSQTKTMTLRQLKKTPAFSLRFRH